MINNIEMCSGCTACISICPFDAIIEDYNCEGFFYPKVVSEMCLNCNKCIKVCQINKKIIEHNVNTYIVQNKDEKQRSFSQSGGLFSALATVILNNNGICYGAALTDSFNVVHIRVDSFDRLPLLQGSKYVQSNAFGSFKQVENDLKNGNEVLYSGTSCMIDGLLKYLSEKNVSIENLFTCDLICHGVPSPKVWMDNINYHNTDNKLVEVNFRDKSKGWASHIESYKFNDGVKCFEEGYTKLFYSHVILRNNCYSCQYINPKTKPADITMADFWGVRSVDSPIADDNTGISLALVHTSKGLKLIKSANLVIHKISFEDGMKNNMKTPAFRPKYRDIFWNDYKKYGYEYCVKKYTKKGGIKYIINKAILKMSNRW